MMYHLTPLVEEWRAQNEGLLFVSEKFSLYYDYYTRTAPVSRNIESIFSL